MRSRELFPTDQPVGAERMIGRREDVSELARLLGNGIHQVLAGPRRTGKTTVCEAALATLRDEGSYVAAVDLFRVAEAGDLAEALVAATVANRPGIYRALDRLRRAGQAVRSGAALEAVMKLRAEFGEELEIAYRPGFAGRDPERYLDWALELPERVGSADDRQVVIFFDEFQELAAEGSPFGDPDRLTKRLRAIVQRSEHVTCLFAGSLEHLMRELFVPRRRALHAFGGFFSLGEIANEAWVAGIGERFGEDGCEVADDALERLVELGEGHPRATMLVAQHTHDASVAAETRAIDLGLVLSGLEAAMAAERANHELTVARIRDWRKAGRDALAAARRISRGEPAYGGLEQKRAQRALNALRDAGIVERPGRGEWRIVDPLLRRYLAELNPANGRM